MSLRPWGTKWDLAGLKIKAITTEQAGAPGVSVIHFCDWKILSQMSGIEGFQQVGKIYVAITNIISKLFEKNQASQIIFPRLVWKDDLHSTPIPQGPGFLDSDDEKLFTV